MLFLLLYLPGSLFLFSLTVLVTIAPRFIQHHVQSIPSAALGCPGTDQPWTWSHDEKGRFVEATEQPQKQRTGKNTFGEHWLRDAAGTSQ